MNLLSWVLSLVLSLVLTALNWFSEFLLKPFNFSDNMFVAVFGDKLTQNLINLSITASIAISVLLLVFGLVKVFGSRLVDDTPNPVALVGRFLLAIVCNYWIIDVVHTYVFPFAQKFFDKALAIDTGQNVFAQNFQNAISSLSNLGETNAGLVGVVSVGGAVLDTVGSGMLGFTSVILLIVFAIVMIAVTVNVIKLVSENAERYFTINLLVFAGPMAASTIVSEKSSGIFKSWFQMLLSNILTIIFNIIGFRMIIFAFSTCMSAFSTSTIQIDVALVSLISLIAVTRMVQKFDQLLAQLTFKINPIQNRSLIMTGLAGFSSIDRVISSATGGKGMANIAKQTSSNLAKSFSNSARDGKFGSYAQEQQHSKDLAARNKELEALGLGQNSMGEDGKIQLGNALNKTSSNDLLNNVNKTLSRDGLKVTGIEGAGDNIHLKTSSIDSDGGIGPDALEAAWSGDDVSEYSFDVTPGGDYESQVPKDMEISGRETVYKPEEGTNSVRAADRYYLTRKPQYKSQKYAKRKHFNDK